ncbi:hypothetical protein B0T11DRAFT_318355 [Plectosphaerella cucumerina]|uniref:Uncharacterized protein n=1 Tax=Plectosphaerella cucumerina TaxID=40658 RepID=A0A8K0X3I7_9PEZI|nr:hypothetical protein B0T11DRAFT_318355 [Plectosphaerella cucumerina]
MAPTYDIDTVKASAQDNARGVVAFSQRQLDRVVSPSKRQDVYAGASDFAHERPLLFAFVLFQALFSFLPIVTFSIFALSTVAFALGAALIFALFWIGVALLVLVPTIFLTSSIGVLVWLWAAGTFVVARKLWSLAPAEQQQQLHHHNAHGTNGEKKTSVVIKTEQ